MRLFQLANYGVLPVPIHGAVPSQFLEVSLVSFDAQVVGPTTLQEVTQGKYGEIVMHGPKTFGGCWKRADATHDACIELNDKQFFFVLATRAGQMKTVTFLSPTASNA